MQQVDDPVVVVEDGDDPPLVERGAGVRDAEHDEVAGVYVGAAQVGVLVVDRLDDGAVRGRVAPARSRAVNGTGRPASMGTSRLPAPTSARSGSGVESTWAHTSSAGTNAPSSGTRASAVVSR